MEKILVKRTGAMGDVVWTTPIIFQLWSEGHSVSVQTSCPEVFKNNPQVAPKQDFYDRIIDLDLAYEKRPEMHILEAYEEEAGIECSVNAPMIYTDFVDRQIVEKLDLPRDFIAIHPANTWKNRTWSPLDWYALTRMVNKPVVCLGTMNDQEIPGTIDLRGKLTLQQVKIVINKSQALVASDSGVLHIGACTDKPLVGLFTSALGDYRLPFRGKTRAVSPKLDCIGCLHRQPVPVTYVGCEKGTYECVNKLTPASVFQALVSLGVQSKEDLLLAFDRVSSEVSPEPPQTNSNKLLDSIFPPQCP